VAVQVPDPGAEAGAGVGSGAEVGVRSDGHYHVSAQRPPRFKVVAKLEGRFADGVMFHYPQILQVGCTAGGGIENKLSTNTESPLTPPPFSPCLYEQSP